MCLSRVWSPLIHRNAPKEEETGLEGEGGRGREGEIKHDFGIK